MSVTNVMVLQKEDSEMKQAKIEATTQLKFICR